MSDKNIGKQKQLNISIDENIEIKPSATPKLKKLTKKALSSYETLNKELNKILKHWKLLEKNYLLLSCNVFYGTFESFFVFVSCL